MATSTSAGLALLAPAWRPFGGLLAYHFMQNAYLAGTLIAVVAGAVGYFMVARGQSFLGHALSHVGFAGAAAAALLGLSPIVGLLACGVLAALGIGLLGERDSRFATENDVAIGTVLVFSLSLGLLFVRLGSGYAANIYSFLFGTILGVSDSAVLLIALTALVSLVTLALIGRPLLFASLDPQVAAARGVPVRLLGYAFLLLLAVAVAESVQVVGILLIFSLLVTPAATAQQLTTSPARGVGLAILLALLDVWLSLTIAYYSAYPVGFFVTTIAFGGYLLVRAVQLRRTHRPSLPVPAVFRGGAR